MNSESIDITLATANELEKIQSCAKAAYTRYIDRIGHEPAPMLADYASQIEQGHVHVARCNGLFAGFVVFYPEADYLHLENVAVLPAFAGSGIGKALVKHVEYAARDQALLAVELYTNELMSENLTMYPRLGYVEIDRKSQDGFNRVFFRKTV